LKEPVACAEVATPTWPTRVELETGDEPVNSTATYERKGDWEQSYGEPPRYTEGPRRAVEAEKAIAEEQLDAYAVYDGRKRMEEQTKINESWSQVKTTKIFGIPLIERTVEGLDTSTCVVR